MKQAIHTSNDSTTERESLRNRVRQFYRRFNNADWDGCFALIDPKLRREDKVHLDTYSEQMQTFKGAYGQVKPWSTRINLHLEGAPKQRDKRPFAYVYVVWQDERHGFHMFRERWIRDGGKWYTRVVGLVPNQQA